MFAGTEPLRIEFKLAGGDRRGIVIKAGGGFLARMRRIEIKWLNK
jgi:hypothetical protein